MRLLKYILVCFTTFCIAQSKEENMKVSIKLSKYTNAQEIIKEKEDELVSYHVGDNILLKVSISNYTGKTIVFDKRSFELPGAWRLTSLKTKKTLRSSLRVNMSRLPKSDEAWVKLVPNESWTEVFSITKLFKWELPVWKSLGEYTVTCELKNPLTEDEYASPSSYGLPENILKEVVKSESLSLELKIKDGEDFLFSELGAFLRDDKSLSYQKWNQLMLKCNIINSTLFRKVLTPYLLKDTEKKNIVEWALRVIK